MSEHFTARAAVASLEEVAGYEAALRRRTEGITWMVWGLASPGIFLTYAFAGATVASPWPWWAMLLWIPWVVAGVLTTVALWRSAALAGNFADDAPSPRIIAVAWTVALVLAWTLAFFLVRAGVTNVPTFSLLAVGTAWTLFGAMNIYRCTRTGRRVSIAIGATTVAVAVVLAAFGAGLPQPVRVAGIVGAITSGLVPLVGGFWQTLRG